MQDLILPLQKHEEEELEVTLASAGSAWKAAQAAAMSHSDRKADPRKDAWPRTADACEKRPVSPPQVAPPGSTAPTAPRCAAARTAPTATTWTVSVPAGRASSGRAASSVSVQCV